MPIDKNSIIYYPSQPDGGLPVENFRRSVEIPVIEDARRLQHRGVHEAHIRPPPGGWNDDRKLGDHVTVEYKGKASEHITTHHVYISKK
ncbi:hypothetical protein ASPZODRAFT_137190 [Penicilliopsis zonata CBS 506.65]|uniref:Uncharacterized protein n=1 Tax=Penicilliopsis zonata CBS 506.65 TaxID=1073090 RepID=A0A1L9S5Y4_9EURO|nr:hypothetical protein ASPZODRAFT_137190 [Penicilliopsis zonata CBS 506.65]OJJ42567.1 hypothetical protein ASPZODRAFT_137190 [Penicilliopsis zonata CBS 506.65]